MVGETPTVLAWLAELGPGPRFDPQIAIVADAFVDLQSERAIGMSVGLIPFRAIREWAEFYGLDHDATIFLKRVLRVVEHEMQPAAPA